MSPSEHIRIARRSVGLLFSLSKTYTICLFLGALVRAALPYVPICFSAKLLDALYGRQPVKVLVLYVLLTVGIVFFLSLLNTWLSSLSAAAKNVMYRNENWKYSEKAMQMAYESIEDRDVALLRERIKKESQTGYDLYYLCSCTEKLTCYTAQILLSLSLTLSFFGINSIPPIMRIAFTIAVLLTVLCSVFTTGRAARLQNDFNKNNVFLNIIGWKYYEYVQDYNSGKDIRIYEMYDTLPSMMKKLDDDYDKKLLSCVMKQAAIKLSDLTMSHLLKFGTYMLLIFAALQGDITVGSIARYVSCIMLMLNAVTWLVSCLQNALINNQYLKRYFSYFDIQNNMYQGSLTVEKRDDNEYFVEFKDVSFRYPNTDSYALRHVSMKFRVGEKLAVVGRNGSGKTTFIKLMCRLYDPTEGEILLNGVNIRKYDYDEYLSIFSVVFQDFGLFSFSLGQNVAADAAYDGERVKSCLEQAGFQERLDAMPDGLETCLYRDFSNDGIEISGGEAQKIALARALYRDAPFIILDEPTAALDPISEYEVYSRFNEIAKDKTAIYISHRLASCRFCDKIAVFDHGRIVQTGTHSDLLSDVNGKYHELWQAQAQYYTNAAASDTY